MDQREQGEIARRILEALYDAWERHVGISLNTVQGQGGWERNAFRTVVDRLVNRGLITGAGAPYSFDMTPDGVFYAEDNEIVPEEKAGRHRKIRQHILASLTDLYDREGSRAHLHHEKIAEGAPVKKSIEILRDLSLLTNIGYVKAVSTTAFRITESGLRNYRGTDADII